MGANIAGIYGAQIFRQDDRPRYRRAFSIACAILAFGLALAIIRFLDDLRRRRRNSRKLSVKSGSESDHSSQLEKEAVAPPPGDNQPGPILIGENLKPAASHGVKPMV